MYKICLILIKENRSWNSGMKKMILWMTHSKSVMSEGGSKKDLLDTAQNLAIEWFTNWNGLLSLFYSFKTKLLYQMGKKIAFLELIDISNVTHFVWELWRSWTLEKMCYMHPFLLTFILLFFFHSIIVFKGS